ncbi:alpha/beta fold hydrolase [Aliiroseovarius sp. 2305UL8-7]|uniref:alpha/beta fold hydrolase n=1 Tax=Aliiroseovarius conchicola TaxID=3121637 RepID=UPI003528F9DD
MQDGSKNIHVGGASLYVVSQGAGQPVIFLHAGVADSRMWKGELEHLSGAFHTVAYDRREFGRTESPDEVFSHVDDLRLVLDHIGAKQAGLVGCSQGGRIAIDFALTYPDRVTSLVLVAPALSGDNAPDQFEPGIQSAIDTLDQAEEDDDIDAINDAEAHLWLDGPTSPAGRVAGAARELFLDMNKQALLHPDLEREQEPPSAVERLSDIAAPTLVIYGDLDFPHVQNRCEEIAQAIPNALIERFTGCAHLVNLEQPKLFRSVVGGFLARG